MLFCDKVLACRERISREIATGKSKRLESLQVTKLCPRTRVVNDSVYFWEVLDLDAWLTWVILGLALMGFEMITPGFVIMWFGVGALVAALAAYLGFSLTGQLLSFIFTTVLLLACSRSLAERFRGKAKEVKTNYNAMVGKEATVTQRIAAETGLGVVRVLGEEWSALAETARDIPPGEKVEVVGVTGVRLVVRALPLNTDQNKEGVM